MFVNPRYRALEEMLPADRAEEIKSLHRRLRFSDSARYRLESLLSRIGYRRYALLRDIALFGACAAYDLLEMVWNRRRVGHLGRARLDGLSGSMRLPQFPHHRSYWYDPGLHALVGMHLGLDLNYYEGKYYVIEINLGAAVKPARRALYETGLDPFITATLAIARARNFERIVFFHTDWPRHYLEEFELATRESGIEVLGGSPAPRDSGAGYAMAALPVPLRRNTIHVVFPSLSTPIAHFIHNKGHSARWLEETIKATSGETKHLAYVPTYGELVLPSEPVDPSWPNLVVKLANKDRGRFVVMGRFRTKEEARAALKMGGAGDVPGVFKIGLYERTMNRLFPRLEPVFQQFIPPRIVDGRACKTRLHVFISPLVDEYLSAHATTAGARLPSRPEPGKVDTTGAYNVSYSVDGAYGAVSSDEEVALRRVAHEFGRVAQLAIAKKFETGPAEI